MILVQHSSLHASVMQSTWKVCFFVFITCIVFCRGAFAVEIPPLPDVQSVIAAAHPELVIQRNVLISDRAALRTRKENHNKACKAVEDGSDANVRCTTELASLSADVKRHVDASKQFIVEYKRYVEEQDKIDKIIKGITALALKLKWDASERDRLDKALNSLQVDGAGISEDARLAWVAILARGQDEALVQEAAQGSGRGFPGAGEQNGYSDCTIYALANATGRPYGYVAALANKFISEGQWRNAAERADPEHEVFKTGGGLNGGEVVMLTEALGQVEVVPSSAFAKTLKEGRPLMVSVVPPNGNFNLGHEVVLSKTFQHNGGTWFEMIDSNQSGPWQRRYLSQEELQTVLQENGVAFRAEPGTIPKLLRSEGELSK